MKIAYVYAVTSGTHFSWKWRSSAGKEESSAPFNYYYECVEDARKHGFEAEFQSREGKSVPTVPRPDGHSAGSR